MAQTTFTVRMDEDTKREFSKLCANIGMTMSTAFSIYAKKAVAEQRIPFELTANADPVEKRIGAAKGKLHVPDEFDEWDKEIAEMFGDGESD